MKVLYIFSGERTGKYATPQAFPDTGAYGMTHLAEHGIYATQASVYDLLPAWLARRVPFTLKHILLFFAVRDTDVVIGSSLLLTALPLLLFNKPAKFVLLNFSVNRQLLVHKRGWRRRLLEWQLSQMDAVISLSRVQDNELLGECPFLAGRTHVVRLGADAAYFTLARAPRDTFILSGGRDNGRDYKTVFEVARLLPDRRFVVFCSRRNIRNLTIPQNVEVRIDPPISEVRELYRSAALLLLSTHGDGFGEGSDCSGQTVLMDAMASGVPIVASFKKYLADYTTDGQDVVVVPPHDPSAAVRAIEALMNDPLRAARMGASARATIERELTSQHMAAGITSLLKDL